MIAYPKGMTEMSNRFCRAATFAFWSLFPVFAMACSVPVFRYAIEHWRPDAYRVFVYHDEDLDDADQALLNLIQERATSGGANVQAQTIDLRQPLEPTDRARWERQAERTTPRMVVQLPAGVGGGDSPVAASPWDEDQVNNLLSSPARIEIGKRLVAGEVVWLFLESGDRETDDRLFGVLNEQLAVQQEMIKLPAIDPQDLKDLAVDPADLAIRFSAVRVSRTDPAEKWFVESLLSVETDLRDDDVIGQAMVFPIFGRGRALYALVGEGINADMIGQAAVFLTGACQCTVKQDNPGVDLLIPVRWDDLIEVSEPEAVSLPLVGLGGAVPLTGRLSARLTPETTKLEKPASETIASESPPETAIADPLADAPPRVADRPGTATESGSPANVDESPVHSAPAGGVAIFADGNDVSSGWVLWLPIAVLAILGTVVGLLGTSILRR
jgi:hypothetical protein